MQLYFSPMRWLVLVVVVLALLGAAPLGALNVSKAEDLYAAVENQEVHIVINEHLDLRSTVSSTRYFQYENGEYLVLGALEATRVTKTIRGDCSGPVPWELPLPAVEQLRPGQCILLTSGPLLGEDTSERPFTLWLDNLYLRIQRDSAHVVKADYTSMFALFSGSEVVWLTRSTVQGDSTTNGSFAAFDLSQGATMLVNDVLVTDVVLTGKAGGAFVVNSTLSVDNTTFASITVSNSEGSGHVLYLEGEDTAAMLIGNNVSFVGNVVTDDLVRVDEASVIYGNSSVTADAEYQSGVPVPLVSAAEVPPGTFLALDGDPSFEALTQGAPPISAGPASLPGGPGTAPEAGVGPSSGVMGAPSPPAEDSGSIGAIVGGAVGAVVLVALAVAASLLYLAQRRRGRAQGVEKRTSRCHDAAGRVTAADAAAYNQPACPGNGPAESPAGGGPSWGPGTPTPLHRPQASTPASGYGNGAAPQPQTWGRWESVMNSQSSSEEAPMTKCDITTLSGSRPSRTRAGQRGGPKAVAELETALDALHANRVPYVGRYFMHSGLERVVGGQGVVQFVRSAQEAAKEYAIKFYTQYDAFARERALYMEPGLREMMPATHEIIDNEQGALRMPGGYVFPPSIVIEKGESLDVWASRESHDFITIMQVLYHVVNRLRVLHAAGWSHRDLKPGNILRRPVHHSWTLIDFGCTARTGHLAPVGLSPGYAAPEVVAAYRARRASVVADPAADMWALGVIAYEMATRERAFSGNASSDEMMARTVGEAPLPWEDPSPRAQAKLSELRGLKRAVLQCLSRNPAARPTSELVLRSWNHMFDSTRTSMFSRGSDDSSLAREGTRGREALRIAPAQASGSPSRGPCGPSGPHGPRSGPGGPGGLHSGPGGPGFRGHGGPGVSGHGGPGFPVGSGGLPPGSMQARGPQHGGEPRTMVSAGGPGHSARRPPPGAAQWPYRGGP